MRREAYACLVPSVILGASFGGFGGGTGDTIGDFGERMDADAIAFWELRNLGFGDRSARDETRSLVRQANVNRMSMLDQVAREVAEAHAQVTFRRQQIDTARQAVDSAASAHSRNIERIKAVQGLPIEVLQSNQALAQARREYLRAIIDHNSAQFTLYRAIGSSARCAVLQKT
jgi:outer membrane protein TolC